VIEKKESIEKKNSEIDQSEAEIQYTSETKNKRETNKKEDEVITEQNKKFQSKQSK
jgi:hypothetical protein